MNILVLFKIKIFNIKNYILKHHYFIIILILNKDDY